MIAASHDFKLKFEIQRRRGKSEHQRAASPLTAGRLTEELKSEFQIQDSKADDKCNRKQTSRRQHQILRSQI